MNRRACLSALLAPVLPGQEPAGPDFLCPMDPDVRARQPGRCPRCGMKLVAGIPDAVEYPLNVRLTPPAILPGRPTELAFEVLDPRSSQRVRQFVLVHERLFHLFLISEDLSFFAHEHPELGPEAIFRYTAVFPKPGAYRLLADFYPEGATPQLSIKTLIAAGTAPPAPPPQPDLAPQRGENLTVELLTEPGRPLAGKKTLLFFRLNPSHGLEPFLGAWGHLLAASSDLIDLIHQHPAFEEPGEQIQFNLIFPRPGLHRVWVQFQRLGVVNTVAFNIPVAELR